MFSACNLSFLALHFSVAGENSKQVLSTKENLGSILFLLLLIQCHVPKQLTSLGVSIFHNWVCPMYDFYQSTNFKPQ
jgi:hypothetical protein